MEQQEEDRQGWGGRWREGGGRQKGGGEEGGGIRVSLPGVGVGVVPLAFTLRARTGRTGKSLPLASHNKVPTDREVEDGVIKIKLRKKC